MNKYQWLFLVTGVAMMVGCGTVVMVTSSIQQGYMGLVGVFVGIAGVVMSTKVGDTP